MDLERRRVVDLLPERSAATFAAWLAAHPSIEVISRDRGGEYAEGGRHGAPDARQVADRFHLAKNAGEALERVLQRHRAALREAAQATAPAAVPAPVVTDPAAPRPYYQQRQHLYEEMVRLAAAGWSQAAIARQVGVHAVTVRAYLRAGGPPALTTRGPRPGSCRSGYEAYLRERWRAGCHDAKALWGELREQGYRGSLRTVQRFVAPLARARRAAPRQAPGRPPARAPATAAAALATAGALVAASPTRGARPAQATFLTALLARCPEVAAATTLARDFLALLRERDQVALDAWLARAAGSAVREFRDLAAGLAQDRPAVEAALRLA